MRRKKTEVAVATTSVSQTLAPVSEGVIDLEPDVQKPDVIDLGNGMTAELPPARTEFQVQEHVGETVVLAPGQKAKRKYTRRAKITSTGVLSYQGRAVVELKELTERREKLAAFLSAIPSIAEQKRLTKQLAAMIEYEAALKDRVENFAKENA